MRYQAPSRLVLIQCITTEWTKRTRDAISAGTRHRLPETLPLPDTRPGVPGHVEHQVADIYYQHTHYDEWNNYQKPYYQFWIPLQSRLPDRTLFTPYVDPRRAFVRWYHKLDYQGADYEHWFTQQSRLPNHKRLFEYGNPRRVVARKTIPISLILEGELLQIEFCTGQAPFHPPLYPFPRWPSDRPKQFPLLPGQWMQIRFNEKSTIDWESRWTYLKTVLNVGYAATFNPGMFREHPPTHQYSDLARLW
jgi:hypothetical protein